MKYRAVLHIAPKCENVSTSGNSVIFRDKGEDKIRSVINKVYIESATLTEHSELPPEIHVVTQNGELFCLVLGKKEDSNDMLDALC